MEEHTYDPKPPQNNRKCGSKGANSGASYGAVPGRPFAEAHGCERQRALLIRDGAVQIVHLLFRAQQLGLGGDEELLDFRHRVLGKLQFLLQQACHI